MHRASADALPAINFTEIPTHSNKVITIEYYNKVLRM
jgi:hypothetical protein